MSLALAAFIVAAFGLFIAGVSLGWQIVSFLLSGSRVRVETARMVIHGGPGIAPEPVVRVTARNVGRQPVSISSCWLDLEDGTSLFQPIPHALNMALPQTVNPGHDLNYVYAEDSLLTGRRAGEEELRLRGGFSLGTGKSRRSKNWVTVSARQLRASERQE